MGLNQYIFELIYNLSQRNFAVDGLMIFVAKYLPYFLVLGFLIFAFSKKDNRLRIFTVSEAALAIILSRGIVTEVIRFFYNYQRPFEKLGLTALVDASSNSFPSGHAAWFFALAMVIFYFSRRLGTWYFVFAALNGLARVYAGVHWPLDILGGAAIGVLCALLVHRILRKYGEGISTGPEIGAGG